MERRLQFKVGDRVRVSWSGRWIFGIVMDIEADGDGLPYRVQTAKTRWNWYAADEVKPAIKLSPEAKSVWGDIINDA